MNDPSKADRIIIINLFENFLSIIKDLAYL